jgi:hypothetical protein
MADNLLIDDLYKMTFDKPVAGRKSNKLVRQALVAARRFVLDEAMSSFLADVAFAVLKKGSDAVSLKSLDVARRSARLPHDVTWIEFDVAKFDTREIELWGERINYDPPEVGGVRGQHDHGEESHRCALACACRHPSISCAAHTPL